LRNDDYRAGPNGSPLQAGAIPLRFIDGRTEVLLVTSVVSASWGIPKGWPHEGELLHDAAVREAREEAGISGSIAQAPIAVYHYEKAALGGKPGARDIAAYLMLVDAEDVEWPEHRRRKRSWFDLPTAASLVKSRALGAIIASLPATLAPDCANIATLARIDIAEPASARDPVRPLSSPRTRKCRHDD
jgi:8-oxo-dGTP pyrophosphatase MutT (NUDIX family)